MTQKKHLNSSLFMPSKEICCQTCMPITKKNCGEQQGTNGTREANGKHIIYLKDKKGARQSWALWFIYIPANTKHNNSRWTLDSLNA